MSADIRICFVGDSFVAGTDDETALGWTGRVCASAHRTGVPVTGYNLGIRRDTSADILLRWEAECLRRWPDACDGRLVISCGVNDTMLEGGQPRVKPDESLHNVRQILQAARRHVRLMVGPPPVSDAEHNARIAAMSAGYADVAAKEDVPYIALFNALVADSAYRQSLSRGDGAHPDGRGYRKMADIVVSSPRWWFHAG